MSLSWISSTSAVAGYNVYRSEVSGGPYSRLDSSPVAADSYTDSSVEAGLTYYYVVTSITSSGSESADSTRRPRPPSPLLNAPSECARRKGVGAVGSAIASSGPILLHASCRTGSGCRAFWNPGLSHVMHWVYHADHGQKIGQ